MRGIIIIFALGLAMAWAGSQGSAEFSGIPVFALCALWAFGLQWLAFIPAYLKQTEKFYDLVGSLTYISCVLMALGLSGSIDTRSMILAMCVLVWAARLGSFLFARIHKDGADDRFDKIKPNPVRFFMTWSLQGLWVLITAGAALAAIASDSAAPVGALEIVGALLWLSGFTIEVIADQQKRNFRSQAGAGQFITTGLWSRSRHPNYFGEILLWLGVALVALPALQGWAMATLVSPVFVYLLLSRVSGVPLLEKKADAKWGGQPEYEAYKANTPVLFLRLF